MPGSIRIFVGFMMVYGAVGTMDIDPTASLVQLTLIAVQGLAIMLSGVLAMQK